MLHIHLVYQIPYLYEYVPPLSKRSFAEDLKPEHRQYQYDVLAGMNTSSIKLSACERRNYNKGLTRLRRSAVYSVAFG